MAWLLCPDGYWVLDKDDASIASRERRAPWRGATKGACPTLPRPCIFDIPVPLTKKPASAPIQLSGRKTAQPHPIILPDPFNIGMLSHWKQRERTKGWTVMGGRLTVGFIKVFGRPPTHSCGPPLCRSLVVKAHPSRFLVGLAPRTSTTPYLPSFERSTTTSKRRRHLSPVRLPVRGDVRERERARGGVGAAQIPDVSKRYA